VTVLLAAVFRIVLVITGGGSGFREQAFSDGSYEGAHGRQASDDDANVGFNCGPIPNRQVIPCYIIRVGELDEIL
jgi:hypothetical protein